MGRWITEDPYKGSTDDPLSLNLYVFVRNSPLIYVEPSGHEAVDTALKLLPVLAILDGPLPVGEFLGLCIIGAAIAIDGDAIVDFGFRLWSWIFKPSSDEAGSTIVDPLPEPISSDIPPFSLESPDPFENFLIFKRLTLQDTTYLSTSMQDIEKNWFGVFDLYTPTWQDNVFISEVDVIKGTRSTGEYASSSAQYQRLKQSLATEEIQSVVKTTEHGAERLMTRGFTPSDISDLKLSPSKIMTQTDGASVYIKDIGSGKFNVIVESENGVVTALKNIGQNSLDKLSKNYGWK